MWAHCVLIYFNTVSILPKILALATLALVAVAVPVVIAMTVVVVAVEYNT